MAAEKIVTGDWGRNKKKTIVPASTGVSSNISASPQESNPQFKAGTDLAGSTVKLADGTNYQMKGASEGPQTPAPATQPEAIKQHGATATEAPAQQAVSQTTSQPTVPEGIDVEALKRSGLDAAGIQKVIDAASPLLKAQQSAAENNKTGYDFVTKSLEEENKTIQDTYAAQKTAEKDLALQKQAIIDETAKVQSGTLEQQKAAEAHIIEQERARYEIARAREERGIAEQNIKNEEQTSRSLASSLGLAFSSFGTARIMEVRQKGEQILSDARAETAYGNAEFAFRVQDIERNYGNELNRVEASRRDLQIQSINDLNNELQSIDEKALLSMSEKKEAGREAIKDFLKRTDEVNSKVADIKSGMVENVYKEVEKIKAEKKLEETADLDMSAAYGYFVNKQGKPVNKQLDGTPTPYIGDYDKELSAQFGYLVNSRGQTITDNKGNKVSYQDPEEMAFKNALDALNGGTASEADKSALNFKYGTNNAISSKLENGKVYNSPKYGKLQCGEYLNDQFLKTRSVGSDWANADALIKSNGGKRDSFQYQVGDVVFMDTGDDVIPHKAIIEGIDKNGNPILTDANYTGPGKVRHGWTITKGDANWKKIYGFARLPLKDEVALSQPTMTPNIGGTDSSPLVKAAYLKKIGLGDELIAKLVPGLEGQAATNIGSQAGTDKEYAQSLVDSGVINPKTGKAVIPADTTEGEKSYANGAAKMYEANRVLDAYKDKSDIDLTQALDFLGSMQVAPDGTIQGQIFNKAMGQINDPNQKQILKAIQRFTEGKLRKESGAAIGLSEYLSTAQMFFPDPGDSSSNVETLNAARQNIINGMVSSAGRAAPIYYASVYTLPDVTINPKAESKASSAVNDIGQNLNNATGGLANWFSKTGADLQGKTDVSSVTDEERKALKDQGYTDEEINNM
jgi:hypothetical protein